MKTWLRSIRHLKMSLAIICPTTDRAASILAGSLHHHWDNMHVPLVYPAFVLYELIFLSQLGLRKAASMLMISPIEQHYRHDKQDTERKRI
jgi:hypothetical protein